MKSLLNRLFILNLFLLLTFCCYGQEKVRIVEKDSSSDAPIELINLKVKDKAFNSENQILANKDWLKTLSLNLENSSGKSIVYIELEIQIEQVGKMEHPLRLPLQFGQIPPMKSLQTSKVVSDTTLKTLKSNKTATLSLQPKHYDFLTRFMQENEIEDIERVKVFFEFIVFEDGTAWSKGHEMRRNVDNPNQWEVVGMWQKKGVSSVQNPFKSNMNPKLTSGWQQNSLIPYLSTNQSFFLQTAQLQNHR